MRFSIHPDTANGLEVNMVLRGKMVPPLVVEARRRGKSPSDLASAIVKRVISDNLFAAVLED